MWGIKNFKPMSCEGEDEFSTSAHKDILKVMLMPNARNAQIISKSMDKTFTESRREFFKQCCAVAVVPQQLREALDDMMYKDGESNSYPQIRVHEDMSDTIPADIIVEGEVVCSCGHLLTGFALMLAMYYVFNIANPDKLNSTLLFLQKGFIGIVDDTTKNVKVSKLFSTLLSQ